MNKQEALTIATGKIADLRRMPYDDLRRYLDPQREEHRAPSGAIYNVETKAVWDGAAEGDLRVFVLVDDGRLRSFMPLSREFIVAPDGSFVDEE